MAVCFRLNTIQEEINVLQERYEQAKNIYEKIGINTDEALKKLKEIPISIHAYNEIMTKTTEIYFKLGYDVAKRF